MLKTSDYNIYIKTKEEEDLYLLIHGYTGAVDLISQDIYKCFMDSKKDPEALNKLSSQTLNHLKDRGYITGKNHQEEKEILKRVAKTLHDSRRKYAGITLIPTYNCNFRCVYCYEKKLQQLGNPMLSKVMDKSIVDAVFKNILAMREEGKLINDIYIFGGEPLLKENRNIIEYIVDRSAKENLRVYCVSNGYELEYYEDLLGIGKISNLQITLDGLEDIHNNRRFLTGKKPTFQKIIRNIDIALKQGAMVTLRSNIDKDNLDYIDGLMIMIKERGWDKYRNFYPYFKSVHSCHVADENDRINELHIMRKLETYNTKDKYNFHTVYSGISRSFENLFKTQKYAPMKSGFCGAVNGFLVVDPFGDIYPCWNIVGEKDSSIGHINDEGNLDLNDRYQSWQSMTPDNSEGCSDCAYALFCGGGCPAHASDESEQHVPYCNFFREIFDEVVPEVYRRFSQTEESENAV